MTFILKIRAEGVGGAEYRSITIRDTCRRGRRSGVQEHYDTSMHKPGRVASKVSERNLVRRSSLQGIRAERPSRRCDRAL